jgi:hypothetical protein
MLQADPTAPQCGFEIVDPPEVIPQSPCVPGPEAQVVLAPTTVSRTQGEPREQTYPFVAPTGWLCAKVRNDGAKGAISIDGREVISASQMGRPMREVQGTISVTGGGHTLSTRLTGPPGRSATITVYHHPGDVKDPPHHPVDGSQGIITATDLWADPPRVTPANENGVDDLTKIRASISVGHWPGSFAAHEVSLTYDVQVWRADGCDLVRTLSGSLPVNGEDIVVGIEATWDGRDEGGHWAPSGTYYYSVRVLLERAHGGHETLLDTLQTQVQALEVINNDRWERVSIVNMDDSDRKLDLVCIRTEESLLDVTFQAFAAGTLLGETTYGPQQASIVKEAGNYTEVCFSDVPAPAQSGPDSDLELVVLINVAPAGPLAPVSIRPPPPTVGTYVDVHFSPQLFSVGSTAAQVGDTIRAWTMGTDVGNPVLYVYNNTENMLVAQDDNGSSEGYPEAEVEYDVPQQPSGFDHAYFSIYVLPSDNWSHGETTLCYDFGLHTNCIKRAFGGRYVEMGKEASEQIHVAWLPGGPGAALTILMQRVASLNPLEPRVDFLDVAGSFASGPGRVALQTPAAAHPLRYLFIAPTAEAQTEALNEARVLSNDAAMASTADITDRDPDGDGVGYLLERSVGTCDSVTQVVEVTPGPPGGYACSRVKNLTDTDGDGLSDYWELFGVPSGETQGGPNGWGVPLTRFGADPRHKDVFVELDAYLEWTPADCASMDPTDSACYTIRRFSYATIAEVAQIYSEGTAEDLNNPDGLPGVRLHFDIPLAGSQSCGPGSTLCGDWGGSGVDFADDASDPDNVHKTGWQEARLEGFTKRRWGIFRHAWCGYGGNTSAPRDVAVLQDCSDVQDLAHELGHNVGLSHGGHDGVNCKAHYVSLMNYEYGNYHHFSNGERLYFPGTQQLYDLNPMKVCEGLGIGAAGGVDRSWLQRQIQMDYGTLVVPPTDPALVATVDWNQDGQIEPGSDGLGCLNSGIGAVSAPVHRMCGGARDNPLIHRDILWFPANQQELGPGIPKLLRKPDGQTAIFYHDRQGRIAERTHAADYDSCRDDPSVTCHIGDWQFPKVVLPVNPAGDLDYARFDAARQGFGVLLVVPTSDGRLKTQRVLEVASQTPGQTEWSPGPAEEIPQAVIKQTYRPVIQVLDGIQYVFFWGTDDLLWQATRSGPQGVWTVEHVLVHNDGAPVPTVRTVPLAADLPIDPAVAIGRPPSDPENTERLYLVIKTSLGAAPPQGQDWTDVLYLMEHVSGRIWRTPDFVPISVWHYKNPPPLNEVITRTLAPRHNVALAYVPNDHTIPAYPGDVDLTQGGRLYLAYGKPQTWNGVDQYNHVGVALSHPDDFFTWTGHAPGAPFTKPIAAFESSSEPGNRVGLSLLAEAGKDANPRLAAKVAKEDEVYQLAVSPYSDGIREWRLHDSNDWWVMRDGICRELVRYRCDTNDCERDPADVESTCGPLGPYPSGFPLPVFDTDGESCDLSD